MHHPWRAFRALTSWTLRRAQLDGQAAELHWPSQTVTLDERLLQAERRSAIAHEVTHILRGPSPADPVLAAREETIVERETVRRLIGLHELGEALAWGGDIHQVADELSVDVADVEARLAHLHPSERHYLHRRLSHVHP